jgi:hypothetical protein
MKLNLDSLKTEIQQYLQENGFLLFRGVSRGLDEMFEVSWDTERYPDYKAFLEIAKELNVRLIIFHHRELGAGVIDEAIENLSSSGYDYEDQRSFEHRLRELSVYDGFTCAVEMAFHYQDTLYVFELQTDWYAELNQILEDLALTENSDEDGDDGTLGGYYSKN